MLYFVQGFEANIYDRATCTITNESSFQDLASIITPGTVPEGPGFS